MYYLGVDLGGTNIKAGLVDESMRLVLKESTPTGEGSGAVEIVKRIADLCRKIVRRAEVSMDDVAWVGIGAPGSADTVRGVLEYANNLPFDNVPLAQMLKDEIGKNVLIENDANAAAYGEFMAGSAKSSKSAVLITLGTGVGSGIIIDGRILQGHNFAGGECGHTVIEIDGRECTCGRKGCWEAYSSATGLIHMAQEAMTASPGSKMWKIAGGELSRVDGRTPFDAMKAGDEAGKQVVEEYIRYLACGLVNVINIFQPEILCIGGGVSNEGDVLIRPLRKMIEKERYSRYSAHQTELRAAQLGNDAGIIGAAMLGRQG
ncbi:MAG TPA: ROK family protein [Clostridia bacterium]|nr:ROK family protein [Clostridia bacterium]